MKKLTNSGFQEVEHTADWALEVWAPDLDDLFSQAALGMYRLMQATVENQPVVSQELALSAADEESLLVLFLSELLYISESQGIAFERIAVQCKGLSLRAQLDGRPIASQIRSIKAVTYHDLAIVRTDGAVRVKIVFDV